MIGGDTMSEQEVITRLKEHIQHCINHHGQISSRDENYCIAYIKDFLNLKKKEAEQFYRDNILYKDTVKSEKIDGTEYMRYLDGELVVKTEKCGILNISACMINDLFKELQMVGGAL